MLLSRSSRQVIGRSEDLRHLREHTGYVQPSRLQSVEVAPAGSGERAWRLLAAVQGLLGARLRRAAQTVGLRERAAVPVARSWLVVCVRCR